MTSTLTHELHPPRGSSGGRGGSSKGGGDGDGDRSWERFQHGDPYLTLAWVLLVPVTMYFVGLVSSIVVRRGVSEDWATFPLPRALVFNTVVLIGSSVTCEAARRTVRRGSDAVARWLGLTVALGLLFLAGQAAAWKELAARGVFLASNPSSSFFYLLTASHGAHLLGALVALSWLAARALRRQLTEARRSALQAASVFWHSMDLLWVALFLLMTYWR